MVATSHAPINQVMTSYPGELLHMDTVSPARVQSVNGKWYVLVVVDDFSRFLWVFFMAFKDEAFGFVWDLILRLRNESHKGMRMMLDEHRTPRRFWAKAMNTACYIANHIFLRAFLGNTSYELRFGRQPNVKHLHAFGCRCFVLKTGGIWTNLNLAAWMVFSLGDDEEGTPIFEDEEGQVDAGDAGATTLAEAPAPFAMSSEDEGGPLPTACSSLPRLQAQAEAGLIEDPGEVTSEIVPSRYIQQDHPSQRIIGDLHARTLRSQTGSIAFFAHAAFVASFEPKDVGHALSDGNWVNAMHEELENFERNLIYVDDIIFGGLSHSLVTKFSEQMSKEFEMIMMGELQFLLGLQIKQGHEGTFIHQAKYTKDILRKFDMGDSRPMVTPMSTPMPLDADEEGDVVDQREYRRMIGSLLYVTMTRPDIQFAVCLCARFQASPRTSHRQAVKRIFKYLKYTPELGLWFSSASMLSLRGYSDADFAGYRLERKSTSSTCQFLGSSLVSWSSCKQSSIATSTTEAEYVAAASCCSQLLWMKSTLSDFGLSFRKILLLVDSTSAIFVARNPILHSRTKHIDVRFHFLRDHYEKGDIDLIHVETENQLADIFTKPLELSSFARLRGELGVCYPF
ncbi:hypothetical protein BS78_K165300 [Paspalum vaginatum]|uniref:Reverse transcriptase Ty1/copia-type domain-containing protein n=1 Tax=Paspalum vaginatum TaxID=158149 RepID=A0A9W7X866_9POAL|nr:hypothetical protein BS78_K165300 [Paspalum vaginatum]